ncbi:MAG: proteasome-type protease, partial [Thermosynechococcaceae cyanobacterium]
ATASLKMTYCLAILSRAGLVMAADSRTNAGVDFVSTAQKLFDFSVPGERVILLCTAGNLSMTQNILTLIRRDLKTQTATNLHTIPSMYEIVQYMGHLTRKVVEDNREWLEKDRIDGTCTFLVGGQVKGELPELYMIYPQGNFLQATHETPYLQIGEIKYGKPILDRVIQYGNTTLDEAAKCALLSLDSTMKSNISVGPPINLVMYETDSFHTDNRRKFLKGDPYLEQIRRSWENSLKQAFKDLPVLYWQQPEDQHQAGNWLSPSNVYDL